MSMQNQCKKKSKFVVGKKPFVVGTINSKRKKNVERLKSIYASERANRANNNRNINIWRPTFNKKSVIRFKEF